MSYKLKNFNKEKYLTILLTIIFTFLLEFYIVLLEQASFFYGLSDMDVIVSSIHFFSIKHLILFALLFFIIFKILLNNKLRIKAADFIYDYRFILSAAVLIICVLFEIHGSSISKMIITGEPHNSLLGLARTIKVDEYNINTVFAFSQYFNNFGYFSDIIRATSTDMFVVYGQPVLDIAVIFRPFQWGYLLFSQGKGLSFFWIGRLVALFLVSFEMGMLFTKKNRTLSLAYTLLITFSPFVQWWFAINGLVEMLIFGQLSVLLIDYYMSRSNYYKRLLSVLLLVISSGAFILTFYPGWEIPLAYIFIAFAIWTIHQNWKTFKKSYKDIGLIVLFISLLVLSLAYIYFKSNVAILSSINTVYPGSRLFYGGYDNYYWRSGYSPFILDYMRGIFYPLTPEQRAIKISLAYCISFFPLGIILFSIVQFIQKQKDLLLYLLMSIYAFFMIYYLFSLPEIIGNISLLSKTMSHRLLLIITYIDVLILIRAMSIMKKIDFKYKFSKISALKEEPSFSKISLFLSFLLVGIILAIAYHFMGSRFYSVPMLIVAFIIFGISFFFILNSGSNKKAQSGFLICVILLSFAGGALVNPVESGVDYYFNQPVLKEVKTIVEENTNAIWIVEGHELPIGEIVSVGARTINCVNTYPNEDLWNTLDPNLSPYVYNRYAHIKIALQDSMPTISELPYKSKTYTDVIVINLNTQDLQKLNVSYILSSNELENLSNEKLAFDKLFDQDGVKIYKINYFN